MISKEVGMNAMRKGFKVEVARACKKRLN